MTQQQRGTAWFLRLLNQGAVGFQMGACLSSWPVRTRTSSFLLSLVRRYTADLWQHPGWGWRMTGRNRPNWGSTNLYMTWYQHIFSWGRLHFVLGMELVTSLIIKLLNVSKLIIELHPQLSIDHVNKWYEWVIETLVTVIESSCVWILLTFYLLSS